MPVEPSSSLAELVVAEPRAAVLFERLGLDYCCGGASTLADACAQHGLDAGTVAVLLDALQHESAASEPSEAHQVSRATIAELCDHIVVSHHDPLRPALERITELLATVVRVHGRQHPALLDLERLFATVRAELQTHMRIEEETLFPACRALEAAGDGGAFDDGLLALLEDDHSATGDALCAMRELAGDFDDRQALCSTHRTLLTALRAFELDLHQHVHEENNILFPRVRARMGVA
jgi:regulator of cell morphogenesis and NO signaling